MPLHDTLKPLTLGDPHDIDPITFLKHIDLNRFPDRNVSDFRKLTQPLDWQELDASSNDRALPWKAFAPSLPRYES